MENMMNHVPSNIEQSGIHEVSESQISTKKDHKNCKNHKKGDKFRKIADEMRKKVQNEKSGKQSRRIGSARSEVDGVKIKKTMNVSFQGPNKLISINEFSEKDDDDDENNQSKPVKISHAPAESGHSSTINLGTINFSPREQ